MSASNEIPHEYLCPISQEFMEEPVMLVETEATFDKKSISEWFRRGRLICPMTGKTLSSTQMVANRPLRDAITRWREEHGDAVAMTPSSGAPSVATPLPSQPKRARRQNSWSCSPLFCWKRPQRRKTMPVAVATQMTDAVRAGDVRSFHAMLREEEWDVNSFDDAGRAPLHWAALHGEIAIAEELLNKGACVDIADKKTQTPLHLAAQFNQRDVANLLIAWDANVNALTSHHYTPLHKAAYWGRMEMIQILLKSGAKLHFRNDQGRRALEVAKESPKPGAQSCFDVLYSHMHGS